MPFTLSISIVEITEKRADGGSSPFHAGSSLITGCCVGCYRRAEALTVSSRIASTCVSHTSIIIVFGVHLGMAGSEYCTVYDAAVFYCPCLPVRIQTTGIFMSDYIWAGRWHFPAVSKLKGFNCYFFVSGGKIVFGIPIIIPTHTTDFARKCGAEFDHECCLLIPNENKTVLCFNDKIYTHGMDLIGYVLSFVLFDNSDIFV